MFARASTLEVPPNQIDKALRNGREQILPLLHQQDGFRGVITLRLELPSRRSGVYPLRDEEDSFGAMRALRTGAVRA